MSLRPLWTSALFLPLLFSGAIPTFADDYEDLGFHINDFRPGSVSLETARWQVGVGVGYTFIQNAPTITQTTTNDLAPYGFPDELVVATVEGRMKNSVVVQLYGYRRLTPLVSLGFEADYHIQHKIDAIMQNQPIYGPYYVTSHEKIFQLMPALRLNSTWKGPWRFYGTGGAGWAYVGRDNTAHYSFSSYGLSFSQKSQNNYLSTSLGGGIEYSLSEEGTIGLDMRYNTIFVTDETLHFLTPTARFNFHF
jgi:hypothetical protein